MEPKLFARNYGEHQLQGEENKFRVFSLCTAHQHPAKNGSTQKHCQPAPGHLRDGYLIMKSAFN